MKDTTIQNVVLFAYFFLFHHFILSNEPYFSHFSVKEGLPSSQVYKIENGAKGNLWFLTDKGISKYNGYSFKNYSKADGLTDNVFFDAYKTDSGEIWLLAKNGTVTIINTLNSTFSEYEFNDILIQNKINIPQRILLVNGDLIIRYLFSYDYLQISNAGKVLKRPIFNPTINAYLLMNNGFFYHSKSYHQDAIYIEGFPRVRTYGFELNTPNHNILIHKTDSFSIVTPNKTESVYAKNCIVGGVLPNNAFWISGRYDGVRFYKNSGEEFAHLLEGNTVTDVFVDDSGFMWFCTLNKGVFRKENFPIKKMNPLFEEDNYIYKLQKGGNNELYIAYYNGNISVRKNDKEIRIYKSDTKSINYIYPLNGVIGAWVVENYNLLRLLSSERNHKAEFSNVSFINQYIDGEVFVSWGCEAFIFSKKRQAFFLKAKVFDKKVYSSSDFFGRRYIAGDSGLYVSRKDNLYGFDLTNEFNGRINWLSTFRNYLVMSTNGSGIVLMDSVGKQYYINDLYIGSNFVNKTYTENDSVLWVCSNGGLTRICFDDQSMNFHSRTFDDRQGLSSVEVNDISIMGDTIWIGTTEGLFNLNKTSFNYKKQPRYHLEIEKIFVNDHEIKNDDSTFFSYQQNRFLFHYSAASLVNASKLNYRFKLVGAENNWNYTKNRTALYSNLQPGNYQFIVQVLGEDNVWKETQQFYFMITPPFWKTWWFIGGIILFISAIIYLFFRFRILLYNRDIVRELLRYLLKLVKGNDLSIIVKEGSKEVKIFCGEIKYIKSDGNYIEIHHDRGKTLVRLKIKEFLEIVPDPIEYVQIRRSYIVRIDKVEQKSKDHVYIDGEKIKVGSTFTNQLEKIKL